MYNISVKGEMFMENISIKSIESLKSKGFAMLRNIVTDADLKNQTTDFRKLSHKLLDIKIEGNGISLSLSKENRKLLSNILKNAISLTNGHQDFNFMLSVIKRNIDTLSFNIITFKKYISSSMKKICEMKFEDENYKAIQYIMVYIWKLVKLEYYNIITVESDENGDAECTISGETPLFSENSPNVTEIKQGDLGDCYLIATLIGLADKSPDAIKKCFVNKDTLHEDSFVKMRFYKVEITVESKFSGKVFIATPKESVIVKFNKRVWNQGSQGAMWVKLFERGFAIYRKKLLAYTPSDDEDIRKILETNINSELESVESFRAFIPLCAITRRVCKSKLISNYFESGVTPKADSTLPTNAAMAKVTPYKSNHIKLFNRIKKKLKKGRVLVGSTKEFEESASQKLRLQNMQSLHAYTITSINKVYEDKGFKLIDVQNPNKVFQNTFRIIKNDQDSNTYYYYHTYYGQDVQEPGKIIIDIKDFSKYFSIIEYDKTDSKVIILPPE